MIVKRISFVRRAQSGGAGDFAELWRDGARRLQEAAPAGGQRRGLLQAVVRTGRRPRPFEGVAIEWFDDVEAMAGFDEHARRFGGEPEVDPASALRVAVESRVVSGRTSLEDWWADGDSSSRLLLIALLQRRPGLSRAEFADYWWNHHRPLADRLLPPEVQPAVYVHNYVIGEQECPWDGLGEFYDDSVDAARRRGNWTEGEAAREIIADEERFLIRDTRQVLISDATVVLPIRSTT